MRKTNCLGIILSFFILITSSSCIEPNIIEELGIVTAYGFDQNPDTQEIDGTVVLYQFNPDITDASQIIHSSGATFDTIRANANKQSGYQIVNGQLQTLIFGPTISEEGIFPYLDTIERNAAVSDMLYVAVADQPTRDLMSASNYEEAPNIGIYLHRLIETAVKSEVIVSSTFHEFMRSYFRVGLDPVVPILTVEDNKVEVNAIGMMQNDVLVGTLSMDEIFYARLLRDRFKEGRVELTMNLDDFDEYITQYVNDPRSEDDLHVVIDQLGSRASINVTDTEALNFEVDIKLNGRVIELSQRINLDEPGPLKKMESEIERQIEENLIEVVGRSQELGSDIFGFGVQYNNATRGQSLTTDDWHDLFPNINVNYNIDVEIKRFGIVQ
ncbi:Ger(x)C family spore germination protein [Alkalibacillus haloalkaliphilus]|uniref:Germination protein n=1 Tax=Alkalibacillus haloalkaliphilus TaxID=94136 RepID=A0A511W8W8_9BACI|nr:Ger(x)C family spore germination protein [Alkalibacillus haloalkaliphilus]GEN45792.1 germination protein [Alkalibacillus haloalkaliphilus]